MICSATCQITALHAVLISFFIELQVPLLTSMGEEERALVKAIESGDTDLVYFSILHIWRQVSWILQNICLYSKLDCSLAIMTIN